MKNKIVAFTTAAILGSAFGLQAQSVFVGVVVAFLMYVIFRFVFEIFEDD